MSPIYTGDFKQVVTDYERQLRQADYYTKIYDLCRREPHDPHTYREGFLWHRKVYCPGWSEERHRHKFELTRAIYHGDFHWVMLEKNWVGWQCVCGASLTVQRYVLQAEMIPSWVQVEQVWPG
jgi:hypothetical protein